MLLSLSFDACASNWFVISTDGKITTSIDLSSITPDGKYRKAWFMFNDVNERPPNQWSNFKKFHSNKYLEYFSCSERKSLTVQSAFYEGESGTGEYLGSFKTSPNTLLFNEVIPDTVGETSLRVVCPKT